MREIKFRAWHPLNKEVVYEKKGQNFGYGGYTRSDILKDFEDENIMQFTGLPDIDGNDIFEGDILATPEGNCKVVYVPERASYEVIFWDEANLGLWEATGFGKNYLKIIGNIYETPSNNESVSKESEK